MCIKLKILRGVCGSCSQCFVEAWRWMKHLELCDKGTGMLPCRRKQLYLCCGGKLNGEGPQVFVPLFTEQLILRWSWIFCCECLGKPLPILAQQLVGVLFCDVLWLRIASSLLDQCRGRDCIILVWFKVVSVITKIGQITAAEILSRDGNG